MVHIKYYPCFVKGSFIEQSSNRPICTGICFLPKVLVTVPWGKLPLPSMSSYNTGVAYIPSQHGGRASCADNTLWDTRLETLVTPW